MKKYSNDSGVAITVVRILNFRSLANVEVELNDLTVLIGANNAGKTSFLDALFAAIGSGRKNLSADDVRLAPTEAIAPKTREIFIDIQIRPLADNGTIIDKYPEGSFWTNLWGTQGIANDADFNEFSLIRTVLKWSEFKGEYIIERRFLKDWKSFDDWKSAETHERLINAGQLEPLALHYVDAKRDLDDDLHRSGSFWRKLTDELGLNEADIAEMENTLSEINQSIISKSEILKHLKENLDGLQSVVSADSGGVDISPVARKLRDLSKGVDVSFTTTGAQSFPLARHGMGTRSLASLLVFRAYVSWRNKQASSVGDHVHTILALEEPESHLHPQAQRSLFSHINAMPGQRVVSTHSPYFAGQAQLEDLRLFIKCGGDTIVKGMDLSTLTDPKDIRKLNETVIDTRGDILFSRGLILFEGQTEEQALPIWAQKYWGITIHELGFCFVRVNGTDYFPYIWLAKALGIPWFIFGDGEDKPIADLDAALSKAGEPTSSTNPNVALNPAGRNFESQLIHEGYMVEIENALNELNGSTTFLADYMTQMHGQNLKKNVLRDYQSPGGKERAAFDAMSNSKTSLSKHLAYIISSHVDPSRRFPMVIDSLFQKISSAYQLTKAGD